MKQKAKSLLEKKNEVRGMTLSDFQDNITLKKSRHCGIGKGQTCRSMEQRESRNRPKLIRSIDF